MRRASIRFRVTGSMLVIVLLIGGGVILGVSLFFRFALLDQFQGTLLTKAQAISTLAYARNGQVRLDFSDRFLRGFDSEVGTDFFELWRADGSVVARSEGLDETDLPRHAESGGKPRYWRLKLPDGHRGMAVAYDFRPSRAREGLDDESDPPAPVSPVHLEVASDTRELDELLTRVTFLSAAALGLFVAAVGVVPPVLRWSLAPLEDLAARTRKIDAATLGTRLPADSLPDELRPIARCLNEVLGRLEAAFERERRVGADLAHELRTPLAELRTWAEAALKWPDRRNPDTDREVLAATEHMEAIVNQMLALARSERGRLDVAAQRIDLPALLRNAWRAFQARAEAKGLEIAFATEPVSVESDPTLLRSILTNLLDNAVEYSPAGGQVRLACSAPGGRPEVRVSNRAADFDPGDVARLFERFWRKEEARSGGLHLGLGLAVSRAFAQTLGWSLTAELGAGRLLTFVLQAPAPGSESRELR